MVAEQVLVAVLLIVAVLGLYRLFVQRTTPYYINSKDPRARALCASGHAVGSYGIKSQ